MTTCPPPTPPVWQSPAARSRKTPRMCISTLSRATWWPLSPTAPPCWVWAISARRPVCRSWRARPCCSRSLAAWMPSPSASTPTTLPASLLPARLLRPPLAASIWRISRAPSASRSRRLWSGSWTSPCSTMTSTAPPSWSPLPSSMPCGW